MISSEQILDFISRNGPSLVTDITTASGQNSMLVGAMLSSLIAEKKLKYTYAKWGGSPLYYLANQIELIQKIYPQLNEKDRKAYDLLKEKKVLEDATQTPLNRACLRQLKDFALPLTIQVKDKEEFFWKWYLTPNEEIMPIVREIVLARKKEAEPAVLEQVEEPKKQAPSEQVMKAFVAQETAKQTAQSVAQSQSHTIHTPSQKAEEKKVDDKKEPKQKEGKEVEDTDEDADSSIFDSVKSTQQTIGSDSLPEDGLLSEISEKLSKKQVTILSCIVAKKNSDLDLTLKVPTALGFATYYAKAKKKKKSNDADLSQTFVKAQMLHLPGAYISFGDLTKKAEEMLKKDFAGLLVIKL